MIICTCNSRDNRAPNLQAIASKYEHNVPPNGSHHPKLMQFTDGCVFLAACAAGDKDEVLRLVKRGADIDTANVDGLTALHQVSRPTTSEFRTPFP